MKSKYLLKGAFALALAAGISLQAGSQWKTQVANLIRETPVPELAFKGAEIVRNAPAHEQTEATIAVIKTILVKSPGTAPGIVREIAKRSPDLAAIAAATATAVQPLQAKAITHAAVSAAPNKTKDIVRQSAKTAPVMYHAVALGASSGSPKASREIIAGIVEAVPTVKPYLDPATRSASFTVAKAISTSEQILREESKSRNIPVTQIIAPDSAQEGWRGPATPGPDFRPGNVTTIFDRDDTRTVLITDRVRVSSDGTPNQ